MDIKPTNFATIARMLMSTAHQINSSPCEPHTPVVAISDPAWRERGACPRSLRSHNGAQVAEPIVLVSAGRSA